MKGGTKRINTGDSVRFAWPPNRPDGLEIPLRCSSEGSAEDSRLLYARFLAYAS